MGSNTPDSPRQRHTARNTLLGGLIAAAAVLALWFRGCLGLGGGGGDIGLAEQVEPRPATDAAPDAPRAPCELHLSSRGLRVDGKPGAIEDAVRACQRSGEAQLRVTGGARAGTFDELKRTLEDAGIAVSVRDR